MRPIFLILKMGGFIKLMIRFAFKNLFRNTRRTIAILLTVALGVSALLSFQSFIDGALYDFKEATIHAHAAHGQIYTKGYRNSNYSKPWEHWIESSSLSSYLEEEKEVDLFFPRVRFAGLLKKGDQTIGGLGEGIEGYKEAAYFHSLSIDEGFALTNQENGIMLGKGLAQSLQATPGDSVRLMVQSTQGKMQEESFLVVGIMHTGSTEFDGKMFRIQLKKAQSLLETQKVESVALALHNEKKWDTLITQIEQKFSYLEGTAFYVLDKVHYQNSVDWLHAQFKIVRIIIVLIVVLGIFNTISTSVLERKQEIGNLRANGFCKSKILSLILWEGGFLGFFGATFGILLTLTFLSLLNGKILMPPGPGSTKQFYLTFKFGYEAILSGALLGIFCSMIAAFFAALKVIRIPIAKALRFF